MRINEIHQGDWIELIKQLDNNSIDMAITSPPYWGLRDYGVEGQVGLEEHPNKYIKLMIKGLSILKQKLKKTGSFYLNIGDTYYGSQSDKNSIKNPDSISGKETQMLSMPEKSVRTGNFDGKWLQPKQLMLMPSRLAIAMQEDGWILRNDIIWHKPNPMPSSVKDRLNTTYEHIFHFVKSNKYYYDLDNIREPHKEISIKRTEYGWKGNLCGYHTMSGIKDSNKLETCHPSGKNPGDLWNITTKSFPEAHFATFPPDILLKPIKTSVPNEVCIKCGEPRFPISEPTEEYAKLLGKSLHDHKDDMGMGWSQKKNVPSVTASYKVVGYTKCSCNAGFKPAVVLDPFMGSGTVAMVCKYPGKFGIKKKINWIGFELNPEYIKIANKRLQQDTLESLFALT